jgi:hypothetical protein
VARGAEIIDVSTGSADREFLRGANLDHPTAGSRLDSETLKIVGWVVGAKSRAVAVEVLSDDEVVARAPVEIKRPGVAQGFQDAPGADAAGFRLLIKGSGEGESELLVRTVLEDGAQVPFAMIRVRIPRRGLLRALKGG